MNSLGKEQRVRFSDGRACATVFFSGGAGARDKQYLCTVWVSMLPVDSDELLTLVVGLGMPSHITYYEGALYGALGLGTPQRRVITPQDIERFDGRIVRITGF